MIIYHLKFHVNMLILKLCKYLVVLVLYGRIAK